MTQNGMTKDQMRKLQEKALKIATKAALKGGEVTLKYFRKLKRVSLKEGAGLVSEADQESELAISKLIYKHFPDHKILGEEHGYSGGGGKELWVIDPLDGTTNYVHGFPFFCISIGLEIEGEVQVGVVYAPLLKQLYTARKGGGAYLNGKKISVSHTHQVTDSLLATGFSYERGEVLEQELRDFKVFSQRARGIRRAGSAALDMCMVAAGVFDGFWERKLAPWDTAAGTLLVREAGGRVTNFDGEDFHFSMDTVLATNELLYPGLLSVIKKTNRQNSDNEI